MTVYPSKKAGEVLSILFGLGYEVVRQKGSHRQMRCTGRGRILFSYHEGATVPPGVVRKILVGDAGLSEEEAERLLGLRG